MLSLIIGVLLAAVPVDGAPVCDPGRMIRTTGRKDDVAPTLQIAKAARRIVDISYVYTVSGPCAPLIDGLIHTQVRMRDGTIVDFTAKGEGTIRQDEYSLFSIRTPPAVFPDVPRAKFAGAARIEEGNGPAGSYTRYVGFWHQNGGALIATFEVAAGCASKLKPVLRSRVPVRGIGFFPSPDTSSGGIGLVQDTSPTVRLVTLEWNHADWF